MLGVSGYELILKIKGKTHGFWSSRYQSVVMSFSLIILATPAEAGVKVGDHLKLLGDFRFRYELDTDSEKVDDRSRARIRLRTGFTYATSEAVEFGARLRTGSKSTQSPHQILGQTKGTEQTQNASFGLDQAYLRWKFVPGGFIWAGKNDIALWQQDDQFWDEDLMPEGVAMGYDLPLGDRVKFTLQGGYYLLAETNFNGLFGDDYIVPVQAVLNGRLGVTDLVVAYAIAPLNDDNAGEDIPGGNETYNLGSLQASFMDALPVPLTVGFDYFRNTAISDDNEGFGVQIRTKVAGVGLRFYYYDVPVNSVPAQGLLTQDNFAFSSNFRGQRYQLDYQFKNGIAADFRVYHQSADNENLTQATVPGLGDYVQQKGDRTRYQVNLNVKF